MLAQALAPHLAGNRKLVAVAAVAALGLYLITADHGLALTLVQAKLGVDPMVIHEFLHDGRHVIGSPCH